MTGKEFLKNIKRADLIIQTMQEDIDFLWTKLTSTTAKPKEVNVMVTKEDLMPETIEKIINLRKEINEKIDEYVDMRTEAKRMVDQIEDYNLQAVLIKYYFQNKTLEQTSVEIDKSYQWTCELRDRALLEFEKIFSKNQKKFA